MTAIILLPVFLWGCTAGRKSFDVHKFGAVGDGAIKDTAAFQKALDEAASAKGARVVIPAGNYLIGSIVLGPNTTLQFEKGATLTGSPDKEDYPVMKIRWEGVWREGHRALIHAQNADHIAIVGPGKIVGNFPLGHLRNPRGPCIIEPIDCRDVRMEGFSVEYERMWAIHPTYCNDVRISGLTIRSKLDNGDGIDVDSCEKVRIEHCDIDTGDDAIALKSGRGAAAAKIARPTQDVVVTDCVLGSRFAGLAMGTEMSGGIRNVRFSRCKFTRGANSIYIKSRIGRGGFFEDIRGDDLDCAASAFLRIDLLNRGIRGDDPIPGDEGIPRTARFYFSNVRTTSPTLVDARRIPLEKPLAGLSIVNVSGTCKKGMGLANITGVELKDIHVSGPEPLVSITNVTGTGLDGAQEIPADPTPAASQP